MPKEGVFARVVKRGVVKVEDTIRVLAGDKNNKKQKKVEGQYG